MNATYRRKRPFRTLLLAAGAIVVVGVAGAIVLASALDPNKLRDELQDAVLRATGRDLTVAGGVHLRFGLSPQVEVDDVSLSNVGGGSRPQMIHAAAMRAELALLPLLNGDAVISALTVDQPDIILEHGTDGAPNWQFSPGHTALYQNHAGSGGGGGHGGSHHIEIHSIVFTGGKITWQPVQGQALVFGIDHLTLSAENTDAPMNLSFDGAYQGAAGPVAFTLTGNSGSFQRLQGGPVSALAGAWPLNLQAKMQGAELSITGGIGHPDQLRSYQFRAIGHAADLSAFNVFLPKPYLPPLAEVNLNALLSDGPQGELRSSQLSIHAGQSDLGQIVPGLTVKQALFSAPGPGQLAQMSVDGVYAGQPLQVAAAVMQPDILAAGAPVQLTFSAQAAGGTFSAHGTLPPGLDASGLDVQVQGKAPDLSSLSPLIGHSLPAAHDVNLSAEIGDAGVKLRGIAVRNLMVESSLGDVAGELTVNWSPRHAVAGSLTARMLDLDGIANGNPGQLLPSVWPPPSDAAPPPQMPNPTSPPVPPATATLPLPGGALPLAFLRANDADLSVAIGDLTYGGQHYHDLAAHLQLADGKLTLNPFRAQAPEGAIIGGASIDASAEQPPVAITLRSPSISAGAVASAFGFPNGASGTMQVDAELSGVGQTSAALQASLNGHVGLAMVNGQVSDALVQALIGAALETAGVPPVGDGNSQVRCFAMRMDFANGIGTLRSLGADTSRLSLSGDGTVDLNAGRVDLHLRPEIHLGPTQVSAPVSLQGPFNGLKAALDPVMGHGRVGLEIGGAGGGSGCIDKLAIARNGLGGPIPAEAPPADPGFNFKIKKPKDLLKGLFH